MIGLVLDTNVIVSAHINDEGLEAAALDLVFNREVLLYLSAPIVAEYEVVLARPKLRLNQERVRYSLTQFRKVGHLVTPTRVLAVSPHEADNRFLEAADEASAAYLVTGNKRHFPKSFGKTTIVNARELFDLITPDLLGSSTSET
jgi:putative PIN family toxin of toxin-antitoxin system